MFDVLHHPAFSQPATHAQFARRGDWEHAWSYSRESPPGNEQVLRYLDSAEEAAFEAFFGRAFVGVRRVGTPPQVAHFADACVESLAGSCTAADFFTQLERRLGLSGFGRSVSFAELGAVNAWRSVGAFRLPNLDPSLAAIDRWWPAFERAPLAAHGQHGKAIEFVSHQPLHHWFAVPVSEASAPFATSRDAVHRAMKDALLLSP